MKYSWYYLLSKTIKKEYLGGFSAQLEWRADWGGCACIKTSLISCKSPGEFDEPRGTPPQWT